MNEIIPCPSCQRKVTVPTSYFGKLVQCPQCEHTFTAVDPSDAVKPAAPPAVRLPPATVDAWDAPSPGGAARRPDFEADSTDDLRFQRRVMPHRGSAVLTLGILSLIIIICAPVLGPIAWIMGHTDLRLMRTGQMDRSGEGMTTAGMILGIVTTLIAAVVLALFCFVSMVHSVRRF